MKGFIEFQIRTGLNTSVMILPISQIKRIIGTLSGDGYCYIVDLDNNDYDVELTFNEVKELIKEAIN